MARERRLRAAAVGAITGVAMVLAGCQAEPEPDPPATGVALGPQGPLATDIWVATVNWETSGPPGIEEPTNITQRPGYDNQPAFVPDGSGVWYTARDEHDGQTDIWRIDFAGGIARITSSNPESEYSATPLPDGSGISVVRVEADSTQRLWRFDADGANERVLVGDVAPVGYHAWSGDRTLVMFVLGDPATLQRADVETGSIEVLAEDIGRSIQAIPGSDDVSYVQRHPDGTATIMRLRPGAAEGEAVIGTVEGGDFHAWAPDGTLFMAHESMIYRGTPGVSDDWQVVADFSHLRLSITRLAVSPDGSQIALVGEVVL